MNIVFRAVQLAANPRLAWAKKRKSTLGDKLAVWAAARFAPGAEITPVPDGVWKLTLRVRCGERGAVAQWIRAARNFAL